MLSEIPCSIFLIPAQSSLLSICLADHIFDYDIKDFSDGIAIFQNFPRFICVEMNFHQVFISCCNEAVSLKMFCNVI